MHGLILVKKDSPSIGISDSYQVLGSTVPAASLPTGVLAQSLINRGRVLQVYWCRAYWFRWQYGVSVRLVLQAY